MGTGMRTLVVIPTYNERENVEKVIAQIFQLGLDIHILVVDDGSPDGTSDIVEAMQKSDSRVHLIRRPGKMGLGTAYVRGFKFAIENDYELVFEMDADLSHDPKDIPRFLDAISENDLVIGSRYVNGVSVVNWPLSRLILSYCASLYTRIITGIPVKDPTGGFKCFRIKVLKAIDLDQVRSGGYSFQIEMNYKAWKKGFRLKEIPIVFTDRTGGSSKMSKKIVREAIVMVWKLPIKNALGKLR
jgi:dolichol-phosphate mannosyltransferase